MLAGLLLTSTWPLNIQLICLHRLASSRSAPGPVRYTRLDTDRLPGRLGRRQTARYPDPCNHPAPPGLPAYDDLGRSGQPASQLRQPQLVTRSDFDQPAIPSTGTSFRWCGSGCG